MFMHGHDVLKIHLTSEIISTEETIVGKQMTNISCRTGWKAIVAVGQKFLCV